MSKTNMSIILSDFLSQFLCYFFVRFKKTIGKIGKRVKQSTDQVKFATGTYARHDHPIIHKIMFTEKIKKPKIYSYTGYTHRADILDHENVLWSRAWIHVECIFMIQNVLIR